MADGVLVIIILRIDVMFQALWPSNLEIKASKTEEKAYAFVIRLDLQDEAVVQATQPIQPSARAVTSTRESSMIAWNMRQYLHSSKSTQRIFARRGILF